MTKQTYFEAARVENYAVGAFNVNTYDEMMGVSDAAAKIGAPVVLMASMSSARFIGLNDFVMLAKSMSRRFSIPVYAHLDHCTHQELLLECARAGFDSVMFDGSHLPYEENLSATKKLAEQCHDMGVLLEGELGVIAGEEGAVRSSFSSFTDARMASHFARESGVDALAVSIGNAHGFYKGKAQLQFDLLDDIVANCDAPIVLHGGTGIPGEDILRAVKAGVVKVNVGTELRAAYLKSLREYAALHPGTEI